MQDFIVAQNAYAQKIIIYYIFLFVKVTILNALWNVKNSYVGISRNDNVQRLNSEVNVCDRMREDHYTIIVGT